VNPIELRQRRAALIGEARAILDAADAEKRGLTAEERQEYDRMQDDVDALAEDITRAERQERLETDLQGSADPVAGHRDLPGQQAGAQDGPVAVNAQPEYADAFRKYLLSGHMAPQFHGALQVDNDVGGGYLVPSELSQQIIRAKDNRVFMRRLATVYQLTGAASLGCPSLDTDPSDAAWTPEIVAPTPDTSMAFGGRELTPHQLAKEVDISKPLLRRVPSMEALIRDRIAYKMAIPEENAYLNGSGAQQPLGVFTASDDGIPTSRDVSEGNAETAVKFDGLKAVQYTLKSQYWQNATWIFSRTAMKQMDTEKNGEGQYIVQPDVRAGGPIDRILGFPVNVSEYCPATFTTGKYVGILGDFSYYWIAEALGISVQVLLELLARTNQVGFLARQEIDGMPVLAEAFARVQLA
jgi:HK97 family phage major capsid protein